MLTVRQAQIIVDAFELDSLNEEERIALKVHNAELLEAYEALVALAGEEIVA